MTDERVPESTSASDDTSVTPTRPPAPTATPPTATPSPAAPQPAAAWAPPPAAPAATGQRTPLALAAGILLALLGVLGALAALALLTIGREVIRQFDFGSLPGLENVNDPGAFVEGAATFGGILLLAFSTFYIIGGVGVMRSRDWGRVIGIVIGVLAGVFWLASFGGGAQAGGGDTSFALVLLAVHAYIAIALLFFWRRRPATA